MASRVRRVSQVKFVLRIQSDRASRPRFTKGFRSFRSGHSSCQNRIPTIIIKITNIEEQQRTNSLSVIALQLSAGLAIWSLPTYFEVPELVRNSRKCSPKALSAKAKRD